ncbi:MAG: dihydroorotase [Candidatus Omnitrophota bacterium]
MSILIKGGRVIDVASGVNNVMDVFIRRGKVVRLSKGLRPGAEKVIIDARGKLVLPGLVDMHCHLRQPGRDDEETLESGAKAAAKGGWTTIACMPNTSPAIDCGAVAEWIGGESRRIGLVNIVPVGAITRGRKGRELANIGELVRAGVCAISDDGNCVEDTGVMRRALEYARQFGLAVISHCEDMGLSAAGQINEGRLSTLLGLAGIPDISEAIIVAREIELARFLETKIHLAHISCARSVELIRRAKQDGLKVSAETCPHYFSLDERAVSDYDTFAKVNPPLRRPEDVVAIKQGLRDGVIDCIATDHAPHCQAEKEMSFGQAPFGMIGLETALSLAITELVDKKIIDWMGLAQKMSYNPARILGLDKPGICPGADADIIVVDPRKERTVVPEEIASLSKNTPFLGCRLKGAVEYTICRGNIIYQ